MNSRSWTSVPSYATLTLRFMKCRDKCPFYSFIVTSRCMHLRLAKQTISGLCDAFRVRGLLAKERVHVTWMFSSGICQGGWKWLEMAAKRNPAVRSPGVADPNGCRLRGGSSHHEPISLKLNHRLSRSFSVFFFFFFFTDVVAFMT